MDNLIKEIKSIAFHEDNYYIHNDPPIKVKLKTDLINIDNLHDLNLEIKFLSSYGKKFGLTNNDVIFIEHDGYLETDINLKFRGNLISSLDKINLEAYSLDGELILKNKLNKLKKIIMNRNDYIMRMNDLDYQVDEFLENFDENEKKMIFEIIQKKLKK